MLGTIWYFLILGYLLSLVRWFLARIVSRRFGIIVAWIEIVLVAAIGCGLFAILPREEIHLSAILAGAIACLLLHFLFLIGQMGHKRPAEH
jgi:hypothetical protein